MSVVLGPYRVLVLAVKYTAARRAALQAQRTYLSYVMGSL